MQVYKKIIFGVPLLFLTVNLLILLVSLYELKPITEKSIDS